MATCRFRGDAVDVAQVTTHTVAGTAANGQVYTVTINTKTVTYTATGSDTNTTIAAALQALLAASTIAEFFEINWTVATTVITGTHKTPGVPATITTSATGTGTFVTATSTAATGKNFWSQAKNWDGGNVPATNDDVFIEKSSVDILYGIDQNAVTLTSLNIFASYTGRIGLPDVTSTGYFEYRPKYLKIGATTVNIGYGDGQGSGRIRLDLDTDASTVNVFGTAQPVDPNYAALQLRGSNSSNVLNVTQGFLSVAEESGSTAQFATIRIGSETSPATDVDLFCGTGATLATIVQSGGQVTVNSNVTTWTKTGGDSYALGTAAVTTITQDVAPNVTSTHYWQSTGTQGTGTFRGQGSTLDCSQDLRARTATNLTVQRGAALIDPNKTITFTNPFATDSLSLDASNLGNAPFSLQRS